MNPIKDLAISIGFITLMTFKIISNKIIEHIKKGNWFIHLIIIYLIFSSYSASISVFISYGYKEFFKAHAFTPYIITLISTPESIIKLNNPIWYSAFPYNLPVFGTFLFMLYIRNGIMGLPIFLISYSIWDTIGILNGIYDIETGLFIVPYTAFRMIGIASLILYIILKKKNILKIKMNWTIFIIWFILEKSLSINTFLFKELPLEFFFLIPTILFLSLCFSSIKVNKK